METQRVGDRITMSDADPGPELTSLITPHTGRISSLRPTSGGHSAYTAMLDCDGGPTFVKAVPNRPGGRRDSLVREGLINPHIHSLSPPLLWQAQNSDWIVLGFEAIEGRPSEFTPGAPDLPLVVDILNRITATPLPDIARDWAETRWDRFSNTEADTGLLRGDTLLYTDITPHNLVIGTHEQWAVDWSWPTRGAAFIDPACLVLQLIAAGHSAPSAESWANECDAWRRASQQAIDVFIAAQLRMSLAFAQRDPSASWRQAMLNAAQTWADHRGVNIHVEEPP